MKFVKIKEQIIEEELQIQLVVFIISNSLNLAANFVVHYLYLTKYLSFKKVFNNTNS